MSARTMPPVAILMIALLTVVALLEPARAQDPTDVEDPSAGPMGPGPLSDVEPEVQTDSEMPSEVVAVPDGAGMPTPEQRAAPTPQPPASPSPTATPSGSATAGDVIYLSDRPWVSATNGWGPVERNTSNGEDAAGDGRVLSLGGTVFSRGLGVHATSEIRYALAGACRVFLATIGVDDEAAGDASVVFQVFADGAQIYDSGLMTRQTPSKALELAITGVNELRLVVTDGGNGSTADHGDWADARVVCVESAAAFSTAVPTRPPQEVTPTPPPSTCTDAPGMTMVMVSNGVRFEARGFAPGTLVQAWAIGPVQAGDAVQRPDRWYDASYTANEACRVSEAMTILPSTFGRYGVFLAGERFGGGPAVTMFQLVDMAPNLSSPAVSGTPSLSMQGAPEAPSHVTARAIDRGTIHVSWVDNSRTEQGFRIEVNAGRDGVHAVPGNTSAYSIAGLRPDTSYCFTVKAFNSSGMSGGVEACAQTPR